MHSYLLIINYLLVYISLLTVLACGLDGFTAFTYSADTYSTTDPRNSPHYPMATVSLNGFIAANYQASYSSRHEKLLTIVREFPNSNITSIGTCVPFNLRLFVSSISISDHGILTKSTPPVTASAP
jgi:hypothetical protein